MIENYSENTFHAYPVCMVKDVNGNKEYRDAESKDQQESLEKLGFKLNGSFDEKAYDRAINDPELPYDYAPEEYPKYIEALGRDVFSKEEEDKLIGELSGQAIPANKKKVSNG